MEKRRQDFFQSHDRKAKHKDERQTICEIVSIIVETFDIGNDKAIETIIKGSDKLSHISKLCNQLHAAWQTCET